MRIIGREVINPQVSRCSPNTSGKVIRRIKGFRQKAYIVQFRDLTENWSLDYIKKNLA